MAIEISVALTTVFAKDGGNPWVNFRADGWTVASLANHDIEPCVKRTMENAINHSGAKEHGFGPEHVTQYMWAVYQGAPLTGGTYQP